MREVCGNSDNGGLAQIWVHLVSVWQQLGQCLATAVAETHCGLSACSFLTQQTAKLCCLYSVQHCILSQIQKRAEKEALVFLLLFHCFYLNCPGKWLCAFLEQL